MTAPRPRRTFGNPLHIHVEREPEAIGNWYIREPRVVAT